VMWSSWELGLVVTYQQVGGWEVWGHWSPGGCVRGAGGVPGALDKHGGWVKVQLRGGRRKWEGAGGEGAGTRKGPMTDNRQHHVQGAQHPWQLNSFIRCSYVDTYE
jgi:hypothetical protein